MPLRIKNIFSWFRNIRKLFSGGLGRRPDVHWRVLVILFLVSSILASGWSIYIFWWSTASAPLVDDGKGTPSRRLDERQFKAVVDYFEKRAIRFEEIRNATTSAFDPL
jgi:hypothetical protein